MFKWFLDRIEKLPKFELRYGSRTQMQGRLLRTGKVELQVHLVNQTFSWELEKETALALGKWLVATGGGVPENVYSIEHRIIQGKSGRKD